MVGGGLRLVAIGAVIGVGGSLLLFRLLGTLLFGVTPYDVSTYATVLALLGAVAALALLPAGPPRGACRAARRAPTGIAGRSVAGNHASRPAKGLQEFPTT